MEYFNIVVHQLCILVVYALVGAIAAKRGVLTRDNLTVLSKYITKVAVPFLLFANVSNDKYRDALFSALPVAFEFAVMFLILCAVAYLLTKLFHLQGNRKNIHVACTMFGNCGFMGIPIIMALFPEWGMLYFAVMTVVEQMILWTIGLNYTLPIDGGISYTVKERILKMVNPSTVALVISVISLFTGIRPGGDIMTALTNIGFTSIPMAMIYIGGVIVYMQVKQYAREPAIYSIVLLKMLLIPMLLYTIFSHISFIGHEMAAYCAVQCGMPTMIVISMLADAQGSDGDYATGVVFITTVMSLVTLPIVCLVIG